MPYLLGIDLGTTFTAAAVLRLRGGEASGEPEMVALSDNGVQMPSVLFVAEDGELLVGDAAQRRALGEPDRVAREFKRRIGDPTPVSLGGRAFTAHELAALVVRHVVDVAARREGEAPERIALTHPAAWGAHKKELVGAALAGHGLTVTFLAEPQAAALRYTRAERVPTGSTIAVYDLGGGTFDAAVVRKDTEREVGGGFTLLGRPEGVEYLGGVDFDEAVFDHVRAAVPAAFADLDESDPDVWAAVARVRRDCCEAKEALSSDTEASVGVWSGTGRTSVRLHRTEFEELIRPALEDSVTALRRAVSSAGLEPSGLSAVLLVGGSSRIPLVAQVVSEELDRPVAVDADPKNAIATGAALALAPQPGASWPGVDVPVYADGPDVERTGPIAVVPAYAAPTAAVPVTPVEPPTERFAAWSPGSGAPMRPGVDTYVTRDPGPAAAAAAGSSDTRARLLIGAGGLVGALAIVGAVLFWPTTSVPVSSGAGAAQSTAGPTTSATPPPETPTAPTGDVAATSADPTAPAAGI
ncbi:Hsp70 family protein, partial [Pseudonocardia sp. KRD291]|uniref:Hsp70 family protein n=1 Tax=Pseudonocardia sp. KRD291 TaxID=2792007 RepID=UPI001C49E319